MIAVLLAVLLVLWLTVGLLGLAATIGVVLDGAFAEAVLLLAGTLAWFIVVPVAVDQVFFS